MNTTNDNIYKFRDFTYSYDFYYIKTEDRDSKTIGFFLPKNKLIKSHIYETKQI